MVLIAGGENCCALSNGIPIASAELYNPAAATFAVTGGMNFARVWDPATIRQSALANPLGGSQQFGMGTRADEKLKNSA
jgi:hypothetical protein